MALLSLGPLDAVGAVGLIFALIEPPDRDQTGVDLISVGTVQPGAPRRQPVDQALGGLSIATAACPINQLSWSAV